MPEKLRNSWFDVWTLSFCLHFHIIPNYHSLHHLVGRLHFFSPQLCVLVRVFSRYQCNASMQNQQDCVCIYIGHGGVGWGGVFKRNNGEERLWERRKHAFVEVQSVILWDIDEYRLFNFNILFLLKRKNKKIIIYFCLVVKNLIKFNLSNEEYD